MVNGYLRRFWSVTVATGLERIQDGNEIVVPLPDEWLFLLDPFDGGEALGFFKPGMGANNWLKMKTLSSSWSNQGLRYYKGVAWYRTTVTVPAKFKGRPIKLWFSGIDDTPSVWINGKPLTCTLKGAAPMGRPWEFDTGATLRMGETNVVVVKVVNLRVNELGTGGITGPAMLWAGPAMDNSSKDKTDKTLKKQDKAKKDILMDGVVR
jgi:hypothetical protein